MTASSQVSSVVLEVHKRGWTPIPQATNKIPAFKWKKYQNPKNRPDRRQVKRWAREYRSWAMVTGQRGRVLVLDFDGPEGEKTRKDLGLRAHIRTPSGGSHVWVHAPKEYRVRGKSRVDPGRFPGMDLKAHGMLTTIAGKGYRWVGKHDPYSLGDLKKSLRDLIESRKITRRDPKPAEIPKGFKGFLPGGQLVSEAAQRVHVMGHPRNDTGFWLAGQLRDERIAETVADGEPFMYQYVDLVADAGDHPYTRQEAYNSLVSAFSQPPREPRLLRDEEDEVILLSEIPETKVKWLWKHQIPDAMITINEGDPDKGKSLFTVDLAARVTTGRTMPDGTKGIKGSVLMICAEDDFENTIKPRFRAAGGRDDRIGLLPLKRDDEGNVIPLSIPEDMKRIRRMVKSLERRTGLPVKLMVIDPITAYLSDTISYGHDQQVRRALLPLKEFAKEADLAVNLVRHLNKDGSMRAMYRGGGSIAFIGASRSAFVFDRHPTEENAFVMARVKNNLGPRSIRSMTYRIEANDEGIPRIVWTDPISIDADTLLHGADKRHERPALESAKRDLMELLRDAPHDAEDGWKYMEKAGHTRATTRRAMTELGVVNKKVRDKEGVIRGHRWQLPMWIQGDEIHFDFQ